MFTMNQAPFFGLLCFILSFIIHLNISGVAAISIPRAPASLVALAPHTSSRSRVVGLVPKQNDLHFQKHLQQHIQQHFQQQFNNHRRNILSFTSSPSFPHFLAGVAAGLMECLVGLPLDTIRVRKMTLGLSTRLQLKNALLNPLCRQRGLFSLYEGATAQLLQAAVGGSLLFGINDWLKRLLHTSPLTSSLSSNSNSNSNSNINKDVNEETEGIISKGLVLAAFTTGGIDGFVSKPLEMIKLRQQAAASHSPSMIDSNFAGFASSLLKEGGVFGLFRGWVPTMLREALGNAAFFVSYEMTKSWYLNRAMLRRKDAVNHHDNHNHNHNHNNNDNDNDHGNDNIRQVNDQRKDQSKDESIAILLAGGAAGVGYVLMSHPLETASVLMQCDVPKSRLIPLVRPSEVMAIKRVYKYQYESMMECLQMVFATNGIKGLYCGMGSTILRSLPTYAASFWAYEYTLDLIQKRWVNFYPTGGKNSEPGHDKVKLGSMARA